MNVVESIWLIRFGSFYVFYCSYSYTYCSVIAPRWVFVLTMECRAFRLLIDFFLFTPVLRDTHFDWILISTDHWQHKHFVYIFITNDKTLIQSRFAVAFYFTSHTFRINGLALFSPNCCFASVSISRFILFHSWLVCWCGCVLFSSNIVSGVPRIYFVFVMCLLFRSVCSNNELVSQTDMASDNVHQTRNALIHI